MANLGSGHYLWGGGFGKWGKKGLKTFLPPPPLQY